MVGPGLAGKLGSVLRLKSCISGNLITVILTPRFQSGPFFFSPRDYSPDPSSSSPEILVRTLLLLPPRCKFGLFFFYPRDSSLDPSSSSSSSNLFLSEPNTETKNPSLIYISVSPTHHSIHQQYHHKVVFTFPKFSFKASIKQLFLCMTIHKT